MKSALERVKEFNEASQEYPFVIPMLGAILELEGKVRSLDQTKQDKPEIKDVTPHDLSSGNLINMIHKILTAAGDRREEVSINIYRFLHSLQ
jgi:hypothetical protein